jgi:hypothetical protein
MSVSAIVVEHGGNEDQAIGGLLHDAAEDQGGQETLGKWAVSVFGASRPRHGRIGTTNAPAPFLTARSTSKAASAGQAVDRQYGETRW